MTEPIPGDMKVEGQYLRNVRQPRRRPSEPARPEVLRRVEKLDAGYGRTISAGFIPKVIEDDYDSTDPFVE